MPYTDSTPNAESGLTYPQFDGAKIYKLIVEQDANGDDVGLRILTQDGRTLIVSGCSRERIMIEVEA